MRLKPLLAVALTAITVLSAAPLAQAGWRTGLGSLPMFRSDAVCIDHMDFQVADRVASGTVPIDLPDVPTIRLPPRSDLLRAQPPITLASLGVWVETLEGGVEASPVVAPADRTIPFAPFSIDPTEVGGANPVWLEAWLEDGVPLQLTHSGRLRLDFNRWLAPGTRVRVAWGNWSPDTPNATAAIFPVQSCRGLGVIHEPGEPVFQPIWP